MQPVSLSIVIPSCCRVDLLHDCLESVRRYAPAGTEVLVVDDGSAAAAISKAAAHHGVPALRLPKSRGFCVAANAGIQASSGDIVELLNDDTVVEAGWADAALACFRDDAVAAVAPLVLDVTGRRIDSAGQRYYLGGVAGKRCHGQPIRDEYLQQCRVFGACGCSAFYRRAALATVGGFPESFGAYFDDVDLSFRLNRAGYQVRFEPASRVRHRGGSSYQRSRQLLQQQSRNEERVFWRNVPQLKRAVLHHLAVLAGKALRRWQEGTLTPFLCGRLSLLMEIGDLFRQRQHIASLGAEREPGEWFLDGRYWEESGFSLGRE